MSNYNPTRDIVRPLPSREIRNTLTKEGAEALAYELNQWWHQRGFTEVQHWVETVSTWGLNKTGRRNSATITTPHGEADVHHMGRNWAVRSNLVNGLPPKQPDTTYR